MGAIADTLRRELTQAEFSEGYAESFLDSSIATQIKVLREQRAMTQAKLAEKLDTTQTVISRIENVNYSGWNIGTLKKLARAFEVRLRVSFEEYGTLPEEVERFSRSTLQRLPRSKDPRLIHKGSSDEAETEQEPGETSRIGQSASYANDFGSILKELTGAKTVRGVMAAQDASQSIVPIDSLKPKQSERRVSDLGNVA